MKVAAALWEMKPVQTGAKALGAGFVALGAMWAYRQASTSIGGPTDANYKMLLAQLQKRLHSGLDIMWQSDEREWIDILGRLEVFRKFAVKEFDDIVEEVIAATTLKRECYSRTKMIASESFAIRKAYQKIIESVRILRSIIDFTLNTATDDFDEVAVDINAKVEQAAMDAIQDTA
jgi:hypothetical protein